MKRTFPRLSECKRVIFMDCHTGEYPDYTCFSEWDPVQIVGEVKKAGGDAFVFFAKDHFGNCFCDLPDGHRHRDIPVDFTGQIVDECNRQGIAPVVYYSVWADDREGVRHPDWQPVNDEYARLMEKEFPWRTLCVNSPFLEKVFVPHVEYIARHYECAGIYLDTMNFTDLCTCRYCCDAWQDEYNQPLDEEKIKKHPRLWQAFFQSRWNRAMQKAYDACQKHRSGLEFAFYLRRMEPDVAKALEAICGLDNYEVNLTFIFDRAGMFAHGLQARYCRNLQAPATLMVNAFYNCWGEATLKHPNLLATEIAAVRANGVKASLAEYLRTWGKAEFRAFRAVTEALNREEPLARFSGNGWRAMPHIALLDDGRLCQSEYTLGAHKILAESHRQFDIIDETGLDDLSRYKLLWVTPLNVWKQDRWSDVLDWVKGGGVLVMEMGEYLENDSPASMMLRAAGVTGASRCPFSAAYFLPEGRLTDPVCGDLPLLLHETTWVFTGNGLERLVDVCDPIAEWNPPKVVFRTNVLPPRIETRRAGIVSSKYGKGRIILLPGSVSRAYSSHNYAPLRRLTARLLSDVCPNPYKVQGPSTLEANFLENGSSKALHLVTYCINVAGGDEVKSDESNHKELWANARFSDIEDITPLHDIPVWVEETLAPNGVRLQPDDVELPCERRNGKIYCVIPRIDLHAVLELF